MKKTFNMKNSHILFFFKFFLQHYYFYLFFLATHKHSSGFTKVTGGDECHVGDDPGHGNYDNGPYDSAVLACFQRLSNATDKLVLVHMEQD